LQTVGAHYAGNQDLLVLDHPTVIRQGPITVNVARASVDFRSGATALGRIEGHL
jgi:hypothetical protein